MPLQEIILTGSHGKCDDHDIAFMVTMIIKLKKLKCIEFTNKGDELNDVFTYHTKFLKYGPS
jgi:hypothetical protein